MPAFVNSVFNSGDIYFRVVDADKIEIGLIQFDQQKSLVWASTSYFFFKTDPFFKFGILTERLTIVLPGVSVLSGWTDMIWLSLIILTVKPRAWEDLSALDAATSADWIKTFSSLSFEILFFEPSASNIPFFMLYLSFVYACQISFIHF